MVKYRPHRGALCDAMAEMRIFDSVEDMFHYVVEDWKAYGNPFDIGDLTITCDEGKDERITGKKADMSALDECEKRFLTRRSVLECVRLNRRTEIIT